MSLELRIVEVEWEDSAGTSRYVSVTERDEFFAKPPLMLSTVGYVMRDDDRGIGLVETAPVQHDDEDGRQWGACIMIPRSAVRKVRRLR
mgnify:CR=1 FL=1